MSFTPRPYQLDLADKVVNYKGDKKILIHLLTGMGKTKLFFHITELLKKKRFIFIVPRINLSLQTFQEKEGLGLIQGSTSTNLKSRIVIATAQTLINRVEKGRIDLSAFDYLVVDEVHALKYKRTSEYKDMGAVQKIEEHSPESLKIVALSATPFNGDASTLIGWGDEECVTFGKEYNFRYAIKNEYLSPLIIREVTKIDSSSLIKSSASGDFTENSVKKMLQENKGLDIVGSCVPHIVGKTCVFASNIEHCNTLNTSFLEAGMVSEVMHSKMQGKPKDALARFNRGETEVLVTVDMLSFGQDVHKLETIIFACAIGSMSSYFQKLGRGLRPADGKTFCHLLDCMGNVERLGHPFLPVKEKSAKTKRKNKECEECGENKPYITVDVEVLEEEQVKRVTKCCPCCRNQVIDLLPLPCIECEECGVLNVLGSTYQKADKIIMDCTQCNHAITVDVITPKEMVITFESREMAIADIVMGAKSRFVDNPTMRDEFLASFALFTRYAKNSDLSAIMNFVLNLKGNYSTSSFSKVTTRMRAFRDTEAFSKRGELINMFGKNGRVVPANFHELIDFVIDNTEESEQYRLSPIVQKVLTVSAKHLLKTNGEAIPFKKLKTIACRMFPHLKKKKIK